MISELLINWLISTEKDMENHKNQIILFTAITTSHPLKMLKCIFFFLTGHQRYNHLFKCNKMFNWQICGDLKVIAMVLGLQGGFTKYYHFLCLWESSATKHHCVRNVWPKRVSSNMELPISSTCDLLIHRKYFFHLCISS